MKKIPLEEYNIYCSNPAGRIKLKLFSDITGKIGYTPSGEEAKSFLLDLLNQFPDNSGIIEFFKDLLSRDSCQSVSEKELLLPENIEQTLDYLKKYPLSNPELLIFKNYCVWVSCSEEEGDYYYRVLVTDENHYPSVVVHSEVNVSALPPVPAFYFFSGNKNIELARNACIQPYPSLILTLKILNYVASNPTGSFINPQKLADIGKDLGTTHTPPTDDYLMQLLTQLTKGQLGCSKAIVDLKMIKAYDPDFLIDQLPQQLIRKAQKDYEKLKSMGMLVYWKGGKFIMSDDYVTYALVKKKRERKVPVTIIGNFTRNNKKVQVLRQGGVELLPPVHKMSFGGKKKLSQQAQDYLVDKYLDSSLDIDQYLKFKANTKCVVLTEDKNTKAIEVLLRSSNFHMEEVEVKSYGGCANITSVKMYKDGISKIDSDICLIVHRDRDYLTDEEIQKLHTDFKKVGINLFVTTGTDVESHFLNAQHINKLHPSISIDQAQQAINQATDQQEEESIKKFKIKEFGDKYKNKSSHLTNSINQIYQNDKERFRHGKKVLKALRANTKQDFKISIRLEQPTEFIKVDSLATIAKDIWE